MRGDMGGLNNSLRGQIRHPTSTSVDSRNWTENCDHDIMNQQLFLPHYPPSQPQTPHSQHTGHPFQPVHSKCINQKPPQRQRPRGRVLYLCVERENPFPLRVRIKKAFLLSYLPILFHILTSHSSSHSHLHTVK